MKTAPDFESRCKKLESTLINLADLFDIADTAQRAARGTPKTGEKMAQWRKAILKLANAKAALLRAGMALKNKAST